MNPLGIVVSAFPGVGKTTLVTQNNSKYTICDSDSSSYSKNKFPSNYVKDIKEKKKLFDIILVSTHENVREEMEKQKVYYQIVHPSIECKEEYIQRYKNRGSSDAFIKLLSDNWEKWIESCLYDGSYDYNSFRSLNGYILGPDQYLSCLVDKIVKFELNRQKV